MAKILFKSFNNNEYYYNIITRKITPKSFNEQNEEVDIQKFFSGMKKMDFSDFKDSIMNQAEILILNITEDCNFRCRYCIYSGGYKDYRTHTEKYMKFDIAKKAIDDFIKRTHTTLKQNKNISINFYGGEPLLAIDTIKKLRGYIISKYKKINKRIMHSITTNGSLLSDENIIKFLVENNFTLLVSVDGPPEIHNKYRRDINNNNTFERIYENLKFISKKYPEFFKERLGYIVTVVPPEEYKKRIDFFSNDPLFKGHNFIVTTVNTNNTTLPFLQNPEWDTPETLEEIGISLIKKAKNDLIDEGIFERSLFMKSLTQLRMAQKEIGTKVLQPNGACIPGQRRLYVSTDGYYYPCEKISEIEGFRIGSVDKDIDIEKSYKIYNDYIEMSQNDCISCPFGNICDYCYTVAVNNGYMNLDTKRVQCFNKTGYMKLILKIYATFLEEVPSNKWKYWIPEELF